MPIRAYQNPHHGPKANGHRDQYHHRHDQQPANQKSRDSHEQCHWPIGNFLQRSHQGGHIHQLAQWRPLPEAGKQNQRQQTGAPRNDLPKRRLSTFSRNELGFIGSARVDKGFIGYDLVHIGGNGAVEIPQRPGAPAQPLHRADQ